MTPFDLNLRHWRKFRGWTQRELASRSGIPRPNLIALEQGRRECTLTTLRRIAHAFEISPGTLLDQPPPQRAKRETLDRYEIDRIARSLLTGGGGLPVPLQEIRDEVSLKVAPLLRAVGLTESQPSRKRTRPFVSSTLVSAVSQRVSKLLASHLKEA